MQRLNPFGVCRLALIRFSLVRFGLVKKRLKPFGVGRFGFGSHLFDIMFCVDNELFVYLGFWQKQD